jgi:predicted YcjX-like family ATPase
MTPLTMTLVCVSLMFVSWWVGRKTKHLDTITITSILLMKRIDKALVLSVDKKHVTQEQMKKIAHEIEKCVINNNYEKENKI